MDRRGFLELSPSGALGTDTGIRIVTSTGLHIEVNSGFDPSGLCTVLACLTSNDLPDPATRIYFTGCLRRSALEKPYIPFCANFVNFWKEPFLKTVLPFLRLCSAMTSKLSVYST